jgi:hypothetical protein
MMSLPIDMQFIIEATAEELKGLIDQIRLQNEFDQELSAQSAFSSGTSVCGDGETRPTAFDDGISNES